MQEVWEDISGFKGYVVSNLGNVCHVRRGLNLTQHANLNGVIYVSLRKDGHQYQRSVSRLVAANFLPPPPPSIFQIAVIHYDGDKRNNREDNLGWRPRPFAIAHQRQFYTTYRRYFPWFLGPGCDVGHAREGGCYVCLERR
jgi:hypothetical protein